jgi:hypothetical protein
MVDYATDIEFPRPDWVMYGTPAPRGNGVWLVASKELNSADIDARFHRPDLLDQFDQFGPVPGPATSKRVRLVVEMRNFIIIEAPDYPAAFAHLFAQWSPEPDQAAVPELGPGPRELPR